LVIKTVFSLLPEMKVECAFETQNSPNKHRPSCFQVSLNHLFVFISIDLNNFHFLNK
jgi:hypothetical protein